ncbi:MAG: hypothetical protein WAJ85_06545 [Candidatus Baltobacteraceae bacterium]|jgi:hypothetical protein
MPNWAPEAAAVVMLPASVSAKATIVPGPTTARKRSSQPRLEAIAAAGSTMEQAAVAGADASFLTVLDYPIKDFMIV